MVKLIRSLSILFLLSILSCKKEVTIDVTNKITLQKVIDSEIKRLELPGIAYLATKGDSIVFSGAEGYANIQEKINFTAQTRMQIASISKTIVATAVMQLYEKGLLNLDEDINE